MGSEKPIRRRIRILVKAYPQPSASYGETVCCAGITEDGSRFLRLYPIIYRRLAPEARFDRYDLVEMDVFPAGPRDPRPESHKVVPESIRIVRSPKLNDDAKVRLWAPFIAKSLTALREENASTGRSLGIVGPDPDSLEFIVRSASNVSEEDREVTRAAMLSQQGLFDEDCLPPLDSPEYAFAYRFTSDGHPHEMLIHDWEVHAAWFRFKKQYGSADVALEKLREVYGTQIPHHHPHFLMGTVGSRPRQFIMIGVLRTRLDPQVIAKQTQFAF